MSATTREPRSTSAGPLAPNEIIRVVFFVSIGLAIWLVSWTKASSEAAVTDQIDWTSLNLLGLGVAFYGQVTWVLRVRSAVGRRARYLLTDARPSQQAVPTTIFDTMLVAAPGSKLVHLSTCPIASSPLMEPADEATHRAAGRTACGICARGHV